MSNPKYHDRHDPDIRNYWGMKIFFNNSVTCLKITKYLIYEVYFEDNIE